MGKFDDKPDLIYALGFMVCSALLLTWTGSVRSVKFALSGKTEKMTSVDAMKFPITGSCVLGGLFLAFKYLPKEYTVWALSIYLTVISVITLSSALRSITGPNVITGIIAISVGAFWYYERHWILNNVLAYGICIVGIEAVQLAEFKTAVILLVLLFFYDIFWVFGTPVMVTVATNVEGPIKLLFPQDIFGKDHKDKSLLGLGDIVIPGFFISQMMRYSLLRYQRLRQEKRLSAVSAGGKGYKNGGKKKITLPERFNMFSFEQCSYFHVVFVSYFFSLITAMFVMVYFEAAQPVLLYIVPFTLLSVMGFAAMKGEFSELWNFAEGAETPEEEAERKLKEDEEKKQAEADQKAGIKEVDPVADLGFFGSIASFFKESVLFVFGLDGETLKEKKDAANQAGNKKNKRI